jgi:lupus La protein
LQGSVFVEFADFKTVDAFLKADPKPSWEDKELLIMTKFVPFLQPSPTYLIPSTSTLSREAYCDMKIKEKGLSGKAAQIKRDTISTPNRKFNAFRDMASVSKAKEKEEEKAKPPKEIYLEFMGTKIKVHTEDGVGTLKEEDIPYVKGASMKFEGCGGVLSFPEIKVRFPSSFQCSEYLIFSI